MEDERSHLRSGLTTRAKGKMPQMSEGQSMLRRPLSPVRFTENSPAYAPESRSSFAFSTPTHYEGWQSSNDSLKAGLQDRGRAVAATSSNSSKKSENMVLVMGTTGAGKSFFINKLARRNEVNEGHNLRSQTKHCCGVTLPIGTNVVTVIDTPGFDDDELSDGTTLNKITHFLAAQYKLRISLKGIVFLHRITDTRIAASGLRYLNIFRQIWGDDALPHVALVSTMWSDIDLGIGLRRDSDLREDIWADMVSKGSYMFQYNGTSAMAETIVGQLLTKDDIVLKIQRELIDQHMRLCNTSAGQLVTSNLNQRIERSSRTIQRLGEELKEAERRGNVQEQRQLGKEIKEQRNRQLRQVDDWEQLRDPDIESKTSARIEEIENEEKKRGWSKILSRVQKFLRILSPIVNITFIILGSVGT